MLGVGSGSCSGVGIGWQVGLEEGFGFMRGSKHSLVLGFESPVECTVKHSSGS